MEGGSLRSVFGESRLREKLNPGSQCFITLCDSLDRFFFFLLPFGSGSVTVALSSG